MLFSIIVPIYNVERYVEEAIRSLEMQDFNHNDFEVIVVDDCSPDNSRAVVESMTTNLNLRIVKHDINKNLGGARNTGLMEARGEWIFFMDSDDRWMRDDVLSEFGKIIEAERKCDIVRSCSYVSFSDDNCLKKNYFHEVLQTPLIIEGRRYLSDSHFFSNVWTSAYRKSFLRKNNLFFRENVYFEDTDWSFAAFYRASEVAIVDIPFYGYRYNLNSITNKPSKKSFEDNVNSIIALEDFQQDIEEDSVKQACWRWTKKSLLSYVRISTRYPIAVSSKVLKRLRYRGILDIDRYELSPIERFVLWNLKNNRMGFIICVKIGVAIKRINKYKLK